MVQHTYIHTHFHRHMTDMDGWMDGQTDKNLPSNGSKYLHFMARIRKCIIISNLVN